MKGEVSMKNNEIQTEINTASISSDSEVKNEGEFFQMNKKFGKFFYAISVGIIASLVLIADFFISPLFASHASFVWIAFINWTVFSLSSGIEKLKAIGGYITGFICACGMIKLGGFLTSHFNLSQSFPTGAIIATFLFNALIIRYGLTKKMITSVSSIFVGMSLTFSGLGIKMSPSFNMISIILIYGIIGLLCCVSCDFFAKKFLSNEQ